MLSGGWPCPILCPAALTRTLHPGRISRSLGKRTLADPNPDPDEIRARLVCIYLERQSAFADSVLNGTNGAWERGPLDKVSKYWQVCAEWKG